jgi:hypothetical protein
MAEIKGKDNINSEDELGNAFIALLVGSLVDIKEEEVGE